MCNIAAPTRELARASSELGEDAVPDESTVLRFRHLPVAHQLTAQTFAAVRTLLIGEAADARGRDDCGCDDPRGAELDEERHGDALS